MEQWKPIALSPDYLVSNDGRVKRLVRVKNGFYERELKPERHTTGYRRVAISMGSKGVVRQYIHRLVAEQFIGPPPDGSFYACHRDGDKTNNRVENVYWGTPKENHADAVAHGTFKPLHRKEGSRHHNSKLSESDIVAIRNDRRILRLIAEDYGLHLATVHGIKTGKSWKHVP